RQPVGLLVAGEGLERARQDHAAEVPQHRLELHVDGHERTSWATAPHSSVDRRSDSWSTRSSSPWNIVPNSSNPIRSLKSPKPYDVTPLRRKKRASVAPTVRNGMFFDPGVILSVAR